jgi:hypothetical protein
MQCADVAKSVYSCVNVSRSVTLVPPTLAVQSLQHDKIQQSFTTRDQAMSMGLIVSVTVLLHPSEPAIHTGAV